ncbi:hypothetical protein IPO96_01925 [Candidatus Saccharibacteria bacterium]|nr:MAG: hypothetical protein IPO96_01925 [Candidatus Saccharibacteria bacterium]
MSSKIIKTGLIAIILLSFIVIVLFKVSSTGQLQIFTDGAASIKLEVISATGKRYYYGDNKKIFIPKGNYAVRVYDKDNKTSLYSAVKISGFLKLSQVKGKLIREYGREVLADNPKSCINWIGGLVVSSDCGGPFAEVVLHKPAMATTPPVAEGDRSISGDVESIFSIGGESLVLIQTANLGQSLQVIGKFSTSNNEIKFSPTAQLPWIKQSTTYVVNPYRDGFVLSSVADSSIYYYPGLSALDKPQGLSIPQSTNPSLEIQSFAFSKNGEYAVLYSPPIDESVKQDSSEIVSSNNKQAPIVLKNIKKIVYCKEFLCVVTTKGLNLYKDGALTMFIPNIGDVIADDSKTYLVDNLGVLDFSLEESRGFYVYTFSGYSYRTAAVADDGLIVSIRDEHGVLAINLNKQLGDTSIDTKIFELRGKPYIDKVSVYKNIIYISPNLGQPTFIQSIGGLGFSNEVKSSVKSSIAKDAQALDLTSFKIITPLLD